MKPLSDREQRLALVVTAALFFGGWIFLRQQLNTNLVTLQGQVQEVSAKLSERRNHPSVEVAVPVENVTTASLIADLAWTSSLPEFQVTQTERTSDSTYRLTVEGKFREVMAFLSHMERPNGPWSLASAEIKRAKEKLSDSIDENRIKAVFQLSVVGKSS